MRFSLGSCIFSCLAIHRTSPTLLIFQKMHKGKHGQTIIFGLSPHEWGAQLGQILASLAKLFIDTKVSNKFQLQHQIFHGHTNFQHKFIILELDANEYCQLDLIPYPFRPVIERKKYQDSQVESNNCSRPRHNTPNNYLTPTH